LSESKEKSASKTSFQPTAATEASTEPNVPPPVPVTSATAGAATGGEESGPHPDFPKISSTKRIFHIPVKSLMLEEKPFAISTTGAVFKGLYMGNPIAAKQVMNIVKLAKTKGEDTVDLNQFDNEVAILMKLSHPSVVSCFGASIDDSNGSVYQVARRETDRHIELVCVCHGLLILFADEMHTHLIIPPPP
jgi:hypothetical protein